MMRSLNHLSIKSKLILMLLAVSSCSILVTASLGYRSGQTNLTERAFNQLTSVRASKAYQIESYFRTIQSHTQTLSENPAIVAAMQEFSAAYTQLQTVDVPPTYDRQIQTYYSHEFLSRLAKTEPGSPILNSYTPKNSASRYLQYHYIADNPNPVGKKHILDQARDGSEYSRVHARYHPIFRNIIQKFGYYDMFLINPQGTIVYTVFKETDFTSNLETGPYKGSNLAALTALVREARQRNFSKVIDFKAYAPSYGAPAAFIAAPIFNQSELVGVLAFQLPVDEINNVMTGNRNWEQDGLGASGETYLVGRDELMRSVSRFLVQNPQTYTATLKTLGADAATINRINQYGTSILQQTVRTKGVVAALAGQQGTRIIEDYRGIPVLSSYAPLKIDGLDWVILAEMDLAEAYAPIYSFKRQILISATLLMLVVTAIAMGLAYLFVKPINKLIESARRVALGHLETMDALEAADEFGELARSFNGMVQSLRTQTQLVDLKNREYEQLLLSVFPAAIAKRLKRGEKEIVDDLANVAVLFADLSGFTKLLQTQTAYDSLAILNDLVTAFDEAAERHGIEKIKTIGDSYLAVCGLSVPYLDHDRRAIDYALEMLAIVRRFNHERNLQLNIQIGINSGEIIAGIVGRNKFVYDIWGDTINTTSRLKDACPPGAILVSQVVYHRLQDLYEFETMGDLDANGQGSLPIWRLKSTRLTMPEGVRLP